jgi:non-ribosomal peptide synthetase component F
VHSKSVSTFPTSFAQRRLWLLDQYEPGTGLYNLSASWRAQGLLNTNALQHALDALVRRHEILRTTFRNLGGVPVQDVAPTGGIALEVIDTSSAVDPLARARELATVEEQRPFDLAAGPLARARLFRLGDGDHAFVLVFHHIGADGWSIGVLMQELARDYRDILARGEVQTQEPPIQYGDYATWQHDRMNAGAFDNQLAYWKAALAGVSDTPVLRTDRPHPQRPDHAGGALRFEIEADTLRALNDVCRAARVTPFMVLTAAFAILLHRHGPCADVCIGSPVANRTQPETERLIGFFVNLVVLRARIDPSARCDELLFQVRETVLGAFANQDYPFERLVQELQPQRRLGQTPLFQAVLALNNTTEATLDLPDVTTTVLPPSRAVAKFDLMLDLTMARGRLYGAFDYRCALYDIATIGRMASDYQSILAALARHPRTPIADLT